MSLLSYIMLHVSSGVQVNTESTFSLASSDFSLPEQIHS